MTSFFNFHFSCTPNWSNIFEMNTSGQQNFSERLSLEVIFTNGTSALAGKGLKEEWSVVRGSLAGNHEVQDLNSVVIKERWSLMTGSFALILLLTTPISSIIFSVFPAHSKYG